MSEEIGDESPTGDRAMEGSDSAQERVGALDELESAVASRAGRGNSPQIRSLSNGDSEREQAEADPVDAARAESLTAAEALHAAAERMNSARGEGTGDQAALATALRAFLDAFAGQNAPTRSEFRDLAARVDRLSSQYRKGR